jgi:hypothetical protein
MSATTCAPRSFEGTYHSAVSITVARLAAIVRFVEIQDLLGLVEVGIEIERRRQTPPLARS